jgi:hypothetical protein
MSRRAVVVVERVEVREVLVDLDDLLADDLGVEVPADDRDACVAALRALADDVDVVRALASAPMHLVQHRDRFVQVTDVRTRPLTSTSHRYVVGQLVETRDLPAPVDACGARFPDTSGMPGDGDEPAFWECSLFPGHSGRHAGMSEDGSVQRVIGVSDATEAPR